MANLKTEKTAAGAQQYSAPGKTKELKDKLDRDIELVHNEDMTRSDFKEKYGMSVSKAQMMVYGAAAAERSKNYKGSSAKASANSHETRWARRSKEQTGMSKGGMTKKKTGYNKGGYCGASNPAARPMKKGK